MGNTLLLRKPPVAGTAAAVVAVALVVVALVATAPSSASSSSVPRQTKRQAEVGLLRAARELGKLSPRFIDPRTRLVRSNTRAVCTGMGAPVHGTFHRLHCVVTYRTSRLIVSYTVLGRYGGAMLHKIVS